MTLQRHHKIIIGSFSSFIVIVLILNSIFLYTLYGQLQLNNKNIEKEILNLQADTSTKINELTTKIIQTQSNLLLLNQSFKLQLQELKSTASADFSSVIENSLQSVVTVKTDVSQGTGFLISSDGYFITNAHVLSGARVVSAVDYEQNEISAEFIGYDSDFDIALLKLNGNYNELELGNSDDIQVGESVIAIGNPLGLQFSVSEGIISAINRAGPNEINAYLQTDAALNPGNSGGPLINKKGKVIGINNFKVSGGESLGFALESNYLRDVVNEISKKELEITLIWKVTKYL